MQPGQGAAGIAVPCFFIALHNICFHTENGLVDSLLYGVL